MYFLWSHRQTHKKGRGLSPARGPGVPDTQNETFQGGPWGLALLHVSFGQSGLLKYPVPMLWRCGTQLQLVSDNTLF